MSNFCDELVKTLELIRRTRHVNTKKLFLSSQLPGLSIDIMHYANYIFRRENPSTLFTA